MLVPRRVILGLSFRKTNTKALLNPVVLPWLMPACRVAAAIKLNRCLTHSKKQGLGVWMGNPQYKTLYIYLLDQYVNMLKRVVLSWKVSGRLGRLLIGLLHLLRGAFIANIAWHGHAGLTPSLELSDCTSWYVVYPIIYKVLYIPGGDPGFLNHQQYVLMYDVPKVRYKGHPWIWAKELWSWRAFPKIPRLRGICVLISK